MSTSMLHEDLIFLNYKTTNFKKFDRRIISYFI